MPSPQKPKGTDELAEVERALSVLQGRHPETERLRREDEARRRQRQNEIDEGARDEERAELTRRLKYGLVAGVSLVALVVIGLSFRKEITRRGKLEQAGDPFRAMGFVVTDTSDRSSPERLEAKVEAGCHVVAATLPTPVDVAINGASIAKGTVPAVFCTCKQESVKVTASSPEQGGGLALLRIDAANIGGSRAFSFLPFTPGAIGKSDDACSDGSLDAWIDAKRAPRPQIDPKWLSADPRRAPWARVKAEHFATLKSQHPFVALDLPKESCVVAFGDSPSDVLSLRKRGGAPAFAPTQGPIAYCAAGGETMLLERTKGTGDVTALAVPAVHAGGALGLRELAREAGLVLGNVHVPASDRAWDAKNTLLASSVPEAIVTTASAPDVAPNLEARIVAASFGTPSALVPEPATDVYSYCGPALDPSHAEALCIFSGQQRWKPARAEAEGGIARSKLPFWLYVMDGVSEPVALKAEVELVGLARRLKRQGFEPTTLEALTELPNGVEVLGRTGEDAIVAVGVAPFAPWVFPYSADGAPWAITGTPPIAPIKVLEKVTLTTTQKPLPPKDKRRTVVFRRQTK